MECDQIRFIYQHSPLCSPHTYFLGVAILRFHWSKKSYDMDVSAHPHIYFSSCDFNYEYTFFLSQQIYMCHEKLQHIKTGGVCGVMVIVIRNEHNNIRSNPSQGCLHFT